MSAPPLSTLTTIGLGGPPERLIEATSEEQAVAATAHADRDGERLLVLGGGSNVVVADAGYAGAVLLIRSLGVELRRAGERVTVSAQAGEPWDRLVARCVAEGLAGIECLSGIPGLVGATPIQNVGAYGQQVSDTITRVRAYDREAQAIVELGPAECAFGYRSSAFRGRDRHVVLAVELSLARRALALPIRYPELAQALGQPPGATPPLEAVRAAVLRLRAGKGLVLDPRDPERRTAGSFFLNPLLSADAFGALERRVAQRLGPEVRAPAWPEEDGRIKTSAAWLIERAGFARGHRRGHAAISARHSLVLVNNHGAATTAELLSLADELRTGVRSAFGIELEAEPTIVGER